MDKYIVEVSERPQGDPEALKEGLAAALNLSTEQAEQLLKRLPGPVTKPVKESKARVVVRRFQELGIHAEAHLQAASQALDPDTESDIGIRLTPAPEAPRMPPVRPPENEPVQASYDDFDEDEPALDTPTLELEPNNDRRGILMTALGIAVVLLVAVFIFFRG